MILSTGAITYCKNKFSSIIIKPIIGCKDILINMSLSDAVVQCCEHLLSVVDLEQIIVQNIGLINTKICNDSKRSSDKILCLDYIFVNADENIIIHMVSLFLKHGADIKLINDERIGLLYERLGDNIIIELISVVIKYNYNFYWKFLIVNHMFSVKQQSDKCLKKKIIKHILFLDPGFKYHEYYFHNVHLDYSKKRYKMFTYFLNTYDNDDVVDIFNTIYIKNNTRQNLTNNIYGNIFLDLILSDNVYSKNMLQLLLDYYIDEPINDFDIWYTLYRYDLDHDKSYINRNYSDESDLEKFKMFLTHINKYGFTLSDASIVEIFGDSKIFKLKILLDFGIRPKELGSTDDCIINMLKESDITKLKILLDHKIYPKNLDLLDRYYDPKDSEISNDEPDYSSNNDNGIYNYLKLLIEKHIEYDQLKIKYDEIANDNFILRETLLCHPGGEYVQELKEHFESMC